MPWMKSLAAGHCSELMEEERQSRRVLKKKMSSAKESKSM